MYKFAIILNFSYFLIIFYKKMDSLSYNEKLEKKYFYLPSISRVNKNNSSADLFKVFHII